MALQTLYRSGSKAGIPPRTVAKDRPKRDTVKGWTRAAARRNAEFLMSVRECDLQGRAYAVTLTTLEVPPPKEWAELRRKWIQRQDRRGLIRLHWVTEWTAAGRPHMHCMAYYDPDYPKPPQPLQDWLDLTRHLGTKILGQHQTPVHNATGWMQYTAKHAARGVSHYQRNSQNIPEAWKGGTGRLWGYRGEWPRDEAVRIETTDEAFYAYRRMVRNWRKADARKARDWKRLTRAREMLRDNDQARSRIRGIMEWITFEDSLQLLKLASSNHPPSETSPSQSRHATAA